MSEKTQLAAAQPSNNHSEQVFTPEVVAAAKQVLIDNLQATKSVRIGGGKYAQVPDRTLRHQAAKDVLAYAYGKPESKLSVHHSGDKAKQDGDNGPLDAKGLIEMAKKDPELAQRLASDILDSMAIAQPIEAEQQTESDAKSS